MHTHFLPKRFAFMATSLLVVMTCHAAPSIQRATDPSTGGTVILTVNPGPGAQAYAVEEALTGAAWPVVISDGGVFDTYSGKIKWGPFVDGLERSFSYTLAGTDQTVNAVATVNADGTQEFTAGGAVTLGPLLSTFDGWRLSHFGYAQLQEFRSLPLVAVLGDGIPNLMRYATGYSPADPINGPLLKISPVGDGSLELEFPINSIAVQLGLSLEQSNDLIEWMAASLELTSEPMGPVQSRVTTSLSTRIGSPRFYRLRVAQ